MKTRAVGLHVKSQLQLGLEQVQINLAISSGEFLAVLGYIYIYIYIYIYMQLNDFSTNSSCFTEPPYYENAIV
jgi:hypothetical protein